ncbi:MAG: NUDIX hydrolase [Caulobacteraceae bacterium]|nr:NUDIX hydrolase [Caulobacteraceae bacterium]
MRPGLQYAALPFRRDGEALRILLVTSRETQRWVIPKGWPMKGRLPHAAAAQEALEEAGIVGQIAESPIGAYHYMKRLKNGSAIACTVDVYPLEVEIQRPHWPEQHQRTAHWFSVEEAAEAVHEPELQTLIQAFGAGEMVAA